MVEEAVSTEQEIYNLCEKIININEDNIKSIRNIVSKDKINYITKKIRKISRYLNNSEISLELDDDKITLKAKLNEILTNQNQISELIKNDTLPNDDINVKINAIIKTIKDIEPIIIEMNDISVFTQKNGIKNNVILYRRELEKLIKEIDTIKESTLEEFETIKESNTTEVEAINKKQNEAQNKINSQIEIFNKQIEEFEGRIKQKDLKLEEIQQSYEVELNNIEQTYQKKFNEMETKANQDFDALKENISKKDEKISELIGLIGNKANIGEYKSNADKAHTERIRWQIATVIIFLIAFLMMLVITFFTKDYNIATLARYIVSIILLGMSGYTGKQASNLRKDEVYYRKQQLELSSIDVYLDDVPEETRVEIKRELSNRIFGQAIETYKSKNDDNTNKTLDKIVKLIENISNNLSKK